jgi:hypothetical protein
LRLGLIYQPSPGRRGGALLYDISLPKTYRPKLLKGLVALFYSQQMETQYFVPTSDSM